MICEWFCTSCCTAAFIPEGYLLLIALSTVLRPKKKLIWGKETLQFFFLRWREVVLAFTVFFSYLMFIAFDNNSNDGKEFRMEILFQPLPALDSVCKLFSLSVL